MPVIHKLDGLIAWTRRAEWREVMGDTLIRHVTHACAGADLEVEDLWELLDDEDQGVIWGAAFEDLLATDLPDGRNLADEYLKRRGWKEPVATQEYIAALRHSVISLYEVSDVVPGESPAQEAAAKTRHLNVWVGADEALFSTRAWGACADPSLTLDELEGRECHVAVDLAATTDLTALALVFPSRGPDGKAHYDVLARCYLNEAAVLEARNASYPGWAAEGWLTVTPGNETDMRTVEEDLRGLAERFRIKSVAFDPWQARQMRQALAADGLPVVEFHMRTANLSEPTKELGAAMQASRIRHDGNPVLEWCIGNVVGHLDARGNVYPRKARPEQKIDAAVALIMALGRTISGEGSSVDMDAFLADPVFL